MILLEFIFFFAEKLLVSEIYLVELLINLFDLILLGLELLLEIMRFGFFLLEFSSSEEIEVRVILVFFLQILDVFLEVLDLSLLELYLFFLEIHFLGILLE